MPERSRRGEAVAHASSIDRSSAEGAAREWRDVGPTFAMPWGMESRDLSTARLRSENEIDNAIYAVLCAAFCEDEEEPLRRAVRLRLTLQPLALEIVDAICAELRWRGRLRWGEGRRRAGAHAGAGSLALPLAEREDLSLMAAC